MDTNSSNYVSWNNCSTANQSYFSTFNFIYDLILVVFGISIVTANLIILIIYCKRRRLRRKSANFLLFNQALVDFFQGTVTNGITVFGNEEFVAKQIIYQFSIALSLHTIVLVSIERYIFILRPLFHKRVVTNFRMRIAVIFSWLSSLVWIPFRVAHLTDSDIDLKSYIIYYIAISDAIFFVLIMLMTYIHISTFRAVRRFIQSRYKKIANLSQRKSRSQQERLKLRHHERELRVTKIFISMFIAFIISYLPLFVTGLIHISGVSATFTPHELNYMSLDVIFYFCNCLFNPIVTLWYKEDYKRIFKQWTMAASSISSIVTTVERNNELMELKSTW